MNAASARSLRSPGNATTVGLGLQDLDSEIPEVKYGRAKELIHLSERSPLQLYPAIGSFLDLLNSPNQLLKWTALDIIGNLSKVDTEKQIDPYIPRLIGFLKQGKMITANHAIHALSRIAANKPEHRNRLLKELLKVERYNYDTAECRNIALGQVVLAFAGFEGEIERRKPFRDFLGRVAHNPRNATRKKALALLKRLDPK